MKLFRVTLIYHLLWGLALLMQNPLSGENSDAIPKVGNWGVFEASIENPTAYMDPFRDVALDTVFTRPDGTEVRFFGFYDGPGIWKFRVMADQPGTWEYRASFNDGSASTSGRFSVVQNRRRGMIGPNPDTQQGWIDGCGNPLVLRSFHVGDRFFAENWPQENRNEFLNWLTGEGYNTLSIASFFLNREKEGRGAGWNTPDLWNEDENLPNPSEYAKAEAILGQLEKRNIYVFPFAGFLGRDSDFPRKNSDKQLYLRYNLARFAPYWNLVMNVSGPEPRLPRHPFQTISEIDAAGRFINNMNPFGHPLTVHNPTNQNPFPARDWISYVTLQGPKTVDMVEMHQKTETIGGSTLPIYSQETIWAGNLYHPERGLPDIRRGIVVLGFSGAHTNLGDMDGNSSSGFSGDLDLANVNAPVHAVARDAWNFLESIPQAGLLVDHSQPWPVIYTEYQQFHYIPNNMETLATVVSGPSSMPGAFTLRWIMDEDFWSSMDGGLVNTGDPLVPPHPEKSWIAALTRVEAVNREGINPTVVARGSYPDLAVDTGGVIHLVYAREGSLYYRSFKPDAASFSKEEDTGLRYGTESFDGPHRGDPEIVLDPAGNPHVLVGKHYAWKENGQWRSIDPLVQRDHALAIDASGNLMAVKRGGNHGGNIGAVVRMAGTGTWAPTQSDPDTGTEAGDELTGVGDHPYGHVFSGNAGTFHVVYRQGRPDYISYRYTNDLGNTWHGGGVFGGSSWQAESPHGIVDNEGTVWIIGPNGNLYRKTGDPSNFEFVTRPLLAGRRCNPDLAVDKENNLYMAAFGGEFNVRNSSGKLVGRRLLPRTAMEDLGYVSMAPSIDGNFTYAVYEQGNEVDKENVAGISSIILTTISCDGIVGKSY